MLIINLGQKKMLVPKGMLVIKKVVGNIITHKIRSNQNEKIK